MSYQTAEFKKKIMALMRIHGYCVADLSFKKTNELEIHLDSTCVAKDPSILISFHSGGVMNNFFQKEVNSLKVPLTLNLNFWIHNDDGYCTPPLPGTSFTFVPDRRV